MGSFPCWISFEKTFLGAGGGQQPGEARLECDKPVLLLVCVNELGLFPSSSSARFSASLQSKFTFRAHGCQHGAEAWWLVVIIINDIISENHKVKSEY